MTRKPVPLDPIAWCLRQLKSAGVASRNAPLYLITTTVAVAVDVFAWGGLFQEGKPDVTLFGVTFSLALPEAIISTAMSLAAIMLAGAASAQRADPRRGQRDRANATQVLAIVILAGPVFYAGSCLAVNDMRAEQAAYIASEQYQSDLQASRDPSLDSESQRLAADRLGDAIEVTGADIDHLIPSVAWIAFLLGCNMAAVRFGWRAPPETEAEQQVRVLSAKAAAASARARQAVSTRQARARGELPRVVGG